MFSYEFCEISKNTFCTEHHWTTASEKNKFRPHLDIKKFRKWYLGDLSKTTSGGWFCLFQSDMFVSKKVYCIHFVFTFKPNSQYSKNSNWHFIMLLCSALKILCKLLKKFHTPEQLIERFMYVQFTFCIKGVMFLK